jgi:hypothetical protein
MAQTFHIFISSPGDVVPERRRAALVIERLAKDYARFFDIKPDLWESEPMLASGHFQDAIVPPGKTDVVVLGARSCPPSACAASCGALERKAFILCLKGLMNRGQVFVVGTMRSDYWHRAAEVPLLVTLAEGRGRIDLLPPTQAEIAMMISRPAEVAGLSFEADPRSQVGLDAAVAHEAWQQPGALPLLSFLLDAL